MKALLAPLIFVCVSSSLLLLSSLDSHGAQISPQLIEQVMQMPAAERERLARQFGVTLPTGAVQGRFENEGGSDRGEPLDPDYSADQFLETSKDQIERRPTKDPREQDTLKRFGSNLFTSRNSMYVPPESTLVPENYKLGPGDVVRAIYFGKESTDLEVSIDQQGRAFLPKIGPVNVAGLSFDQATSLIQSRINDQLIGTDVVVTLSSLREISVFVAGEVERPGRYNLSSLSSVSAALYLAGGITEKGSFREVLVKRGGEKIAVFDLYDLLLNGDANGDVNLRNGDVVLVPPALSLVEIDGEIRRPAIYEIIEGETLAWLLKAAGGTTGQAFKSEIQLIRADRTSGVPTIVAVRDLNSALLLEDGDAVRVDRLTDQISQSVKLSGTVVRPGDFSFRSGAKISDYLSDVRRDLRPNSDLNVSLLVRQKNEQMDIEVLVFSPIEAFKGEPDQDLMLQPHDEIIILPKLRFEERASAPKSGSEAFERNETILEMGLTSAPLAENKLTAEDGSLSRGSSKEALQERVISRMADVGLAMGSGWTDEDVLEPGSGEVEDQELSRAQFIEPLVRKLYSQARAGQPARILKISGAVNQEGDYPLIENASVDQLLSLAGGVQDGGFLKAAEIRSTVLLSDRARSEISLVDLSSGTAINFKPGDELKVNFIPGWSMRDVVSIGGEVVYPGSYTLRAGETLGSLIQRAGGFTEDAFIEATRYLSETAREQQLRSVRKIADQIRKAASTEALGQEGLRGPNDDGLAFLDRLDDNIEGRIVIDMPRILSGDKVADIVLQDGDRIEVPKLTQAVYVVGEVLEPGNYRHVNGRNFEDYIGLAAGVTNTAKRKDTYIISPNGRVRRANVGGGFLRFDREAGQEIEVGSTIVVPPNLDYTKPLDLYAQVSSVVFQSVASIAAFINISNK